MTSTTLDTKKLRAIAHKLKPVVTISQKGLSETVCKEIDRALQQHELIKVKILAGDRDARKEAAEEICRISRAVCVQTIGNIAVLYRPADKPNPKLSNILRHTPA
ncbi:MAG: ribosome assembly RNA-binding protein YhbY [Gammaproteobacteria bacterium]|nr:ribosome assembly RNA-binding protein YhbY [Gammaproteobacteria bacterium]